jgi:peroxiredoxin
VPLPPGTPAPAAIARDLDGAPVPLAASASAGPVLLFFHNSDCPASPLGARVLPRLAAIPGLRVLAVSQDAPGGARAFAARHGLGAPVAVLVDPEPWPASDAFEVRATPTWILLAASGAVDRVCEGWSRDAANALAARAASLVGAPARPVSLPEDGGPALRPG